MAALGGDLARTVMVGDADTDAGSARATRTPLILVDFGYTEIAAAALAPDILLHRFDDLVDACARLLDPTSRGVNGWLSGGGPSTPGLSDGSTGARHVQSSGGLEGRSMMDTWAAAGQGISARAPAAEFRRRTPPAAQRHR